MVKKMKKVRRTISVDDYEHEGDLENEVSFLKSHCPGITIVKAWEEEDFEAEEDYKEDYGECDEGIYQGYITIEGNKADIEKWEKEGYL